MPGGRAGRTAQGGVRDPAAAQQPPAGRVAVALVGDQVVGALAGPAAPGGSWHADRVKDGLELGAVVALPGLMTTLNGRPRRSQPRWIFVVSPPRGPAEHLERVMADPLLRSASATCLRAPTACWWARTLLRPPPRRAVLVNRIILRGSLGLSIRSQACPAPPHRYQADLQRTERRNADGTLGEHDRAGQAGLEASRVSGWPEHDDVDEL